MAKISRFTKHITITFNSVSSDRVASLEDYLVWEIVYTGEPLPSLSGLEEDKYVIVSPRFNSDGITVPRLFWFLYPPWGHAATRAAILHDYLLHRLKTFPHPRVSTRRLADNIFFEALKACRVNIVSCYVLWGAVRLFSIFKSINNVSLK